MLTDRETASSLNWLRCSLDLKDGVVSPNRVQPEGESRGRGYQDPGNSDLMTREPMSAAVVVDPAPGRMDLDKPIYTLSIAAEILETHPRTLMMYEALNLVVPHRTATKRRRYSQRDLLTLQAIQRLTRGHGLNLNGAKYVIQCLQLLDENDIERPPDLRDINVDHVRI